MSLIKGTNIVCPENSKAFQTTLYRNTVVEKITDLDINLSAQIEAKNHLVLKVFSSPVIRSTDIG